jgi:hypothetical protein
MRTLKQCQDDGPLCRIDGRGVETKSWGRNALEWSMNTCTAEIPPVRFSVA